MSAVDRLIWDKQDSTTLKPNRGNEMKDYTILRRYDPFMLSSAVNDYMVSVPNSRPLGDLVVMLPNTFLQVMITGSPPPTETCAVATKAKVKK